MRSTFVEHVVTTIDKVLNLWLIWKLINHWLTGEPIDERGPIPTEHFSAIHAEAPDFVEMSVEQEILVTGIKVVDLLAPYSKGGKIGRCTTTSKPSL